MILQSAIPFDTTSRPLPGVRPLCPMHWLQADDAYGAQMAERARLLRDRRGEVLYCDATALPAARELLDMVLAHLPDGFAAAGSALRTPDGRVVEPDPERPLQTLNALCQEDFCLLMSEGGAHVLRAALLCFPTGWTLSEKAGRPLGAIHGPVDAYDDAMARRVQRLFDGVKPGRPLWRFNCQPDAAAALFQPRRESDPPRQAPPDAPFLRSERQCILRLPRTKAVVFSIHVYVVRRRAERA
jgi:hypothetical protein